MLLSPAFLDQLRARVALSGVIGRTTRLIKAGREFKACCPFHDEKTPSFTVNDEKGFYHCFGCGAHGDAIRWLTDRRGLSFIDAVRELAAEAGMEVPAPDPGAARAAGQRDGLHDVLAAAQAWFVANLASEAGAEARGYLARRGLARDTLARFGFGFAPEGRQSLGQALARFPEALLIEAGLRIAVEGREPYDRFRGRITLPIADARGRVIAFGGRILDTAAGDGKGDAPKYLNSPDTPLFDKGATLYNLHRAAPLARQSGRLIVVEGYMDVVALSAAGIGECVAPLGTALTERQLDLLWRQVERPVLCFDGDAAGQRAAMRAIDRALPELRPAHSLAIVRLPAGLDPDDLVRREGAAAMERLLAGARTLIDVLWEAEKDRAAVETPEEIEGLRQRLRERSAAIRDGETRRGFAQQLMQRFAAFERQLSSDRSYRLRKRTREQWRSDTRTRQNAAGLRRRGEFGGARDALSAAVVAGLIRWPGEIARHAEALARAALHDPRYAALLDALDGGGPLESEALSTILARQGMAVPDAAEYAGLRFGFLRDDAAREIAAAELAQAIGLLVERPALEAALAEATERCAHELAEDEFSEAWAEQQRILKRKLEFDVRLRQMSGALADASSGSSSGNTAE